MSIYKRVIPFFVKRVVPLLKRERNVIIASHGNTMRVILKYLEKISQEHLPHLNLLFGEPITYLYQEDRFSRVGGPLIFDRPVAKKLVENG